MSEANLETPAGFTVTGGLTVTDGITVTGGSIDFSGASSSNALTLTDLSATTAAAGTTGLAYDNTTGVFTYTPPDLSTYLTSATLTGSDLDMGGNKVLFANMYSAEGNLPSATTYHGMFAHVHGTGKGYFAHNGNWIKLIDETSSTTDNLTEGSTNLYYTDTRARAAVSATTGVAGTAALSYNNSTGQFTLTPPDLSSYATIASLAGYLTDITGESLSDLSNVASTAPIDGQVLTYDTTNGWQPETIASGGIALTDLSVTEGTASGNGSLSYDNTTGVFSFTPADTSGSGGSGYSWLAGGTLQMQYAQKTDTATVSLSAATDTVLHTDLQVTITPSSTSSKIRLDAQVFGEHGDASNPYNAMVFFYRNTTKLGAAASGSRLVGVATLPTTFHSNAGSTPEFGSYTFFDEPNTTSAVTYKIGIVSRNAETFYLNRTVSDTDDTGSDRGTSFISATEIAGAAGGSGGGGSDYLSVNSTGTAAAASGTDAIAIGETSSSTAGASVAIGSAATSGNDGGVALGQSSTVNGNRGIALGQGSTGGTVAIGLGYLASATGNYSTSIGYNATTSTANQLMLGDASNTTGYTSIRVGNTSYTPSNNMDLATKAYVDANAGGGLPSNFALYGTGTASANTTDGIAMGNNSNASGSTSVSIGVNSTASGQWSVAVGRYCSASGYLAQSFGSGSYAQGHTSFAAGQGAGATHQNSTALGFQARAQANNTFTLGNLSISNLKCQDTSISATSDYRDKVQIEDLTIGLSFVNAITPKAFYKNNRANYYTPVYTIEELYDDPTLKQSFTVDEEAYQAGTEKWNQREFGFVSQDVAAQLPEEYADARVSYNEYDDLYEFDVQHFTMGDMTPILWKAVRELSDKHDQLQSDYDALLARVVALENA